jgi:uncharacterized protein (DUF58 family)
MPAPLTDPAALMRIRSLELRAKVVVEGMWRGLHRSPYHGFSVEFSEYRAYVPGDDPRYIDWKVAGRSDRYFIKKFEDETNLRCQLVVDQSRSMQFGSGGFTKADYASTLAATLCSFLMKQGDAVGVTTFAEGVQEHVPARNRPGHLRRVMMELEKPLRGAGTSLEMSISQMAGLLQKRGMICVVTDLLAPVDQLEKQLGLLGAVGHDVVLFHLQDRAEIDFNFTKASHFRDAESGREFFVDPAVAKENYLKNMEAHQAMVKSTCERLGMEYHWCPTDRPLELALYEFVSNRSKQGVRQRGKGAAA